MNELKYKYLGLPAGGTDHCGANEARRGWRDREHGQPELAALPAARHDRVRYGQGRPEPPHAPSRRRARALQGMRAPLCNTFAYRILYKLTELRNHCPSCTINSYG